MPLLVEFGALVVPILCLISLWIYIKGDENG